MILLLRRRHVKHLGNRTSVRDTPLSKWHNRQPVCETSFCFQVEGFVFRGLGGITRDDGGLLLNRQSLFNRMLRLECELLEIAA